MKKIALVLSVLVSFPFPAWAGSAPSGNSMAQIAGEYVRIQESLAKDSLDGVKDAARKIASLASRSKGSETLELEKAAKTLESASDLKQARASFQDLSAHVAPWVQKSKAADLEVYYCPMARAKWVQKKGEVHNPYYGKQMQECGEKL